MALGREEPNSEDKCLAQNGMYALSYYHGYTVFVNL